ncbi:MAG: type II toxin-antitoxin system RatA family toxin [Pseudomonadota bacterium]
MPRKSSEKRVPYSAAQMFDLVADVEAYPSFIPWCQALRIVSRESDGQSEGDDGSNAGEVGAERFIADMIVGFRLFREKFRSDVALDRARRRINTTYVSGPMRSMASHWRFDDDGAGGSIVRFEIDFAFRNPLLQRAAQAVFDEAFGKMADAFVKRAHVVYGEA